MPSSPEPYDVDFRGIPLPAVSLSADALSEPGLLFVFAHGAGAGQASPFMRRYAEGLTALGVDVTTFDFPYMAARKRLPDRPPILEAAFLAVVDAAVARGSMAPRAVFVGGKSMGGRMATHLAAQPDRWKCHIPLAGAVALGYPLKPPGPRGGDRVSHLLRLAVPTLIVQGTRDTFGGPDAVSTAVGGASRVTIVPIETGDHSLRVLASAGRRQADVEHDILTALHQWMKARSSAG